MWKLIKIVANAFKTIFLIIAVTFKLALLLAYIVFIIGMVIFVLGGTVYILFSPSSDSQLAEYSAITMVFINIFGAIFYFIVSSLIAGFLIASLTNCFSQIFLGNDYTPQNESHGGRNLLLTVLAAVGVYHIFKGDD